MQQVSGDMFLEKQNIEKQQNIMEASKSIHSSPNNQDNICLGNRNNLMFIETCLQRLNDDTDYRGRDF